MMLDLNSSFELLSSMSPKVSRKKNLLKHNKCKF